MLYVFNNYFWKIIIWVSLPIFFQWNNEANITFQLYHFQDLKQKQGSTSHQSLVSAPSPAAWGEEQNLKEGGLRGGFKEGAYTGRTCLTGSFCFGVYSKLFCFGARRNMYLVNFNSFWPCKVSPVFLFKLSRTYKIIWEAINSWRCGLEKIQDKQRLSVLTTRKERYLGVPWVLPLKTFWQQIWQSKEAYCYECLRFFILKNNLKKKRFATTSYLPVSQSKSKSIFWNYWSGKVVGLPLNFTDNLKATSTSDLLSVPLPFFSTHTSQILPINSAQKKGH